jgi:hypothetical protein
MKKSKQTPFEQKRLGRILLSETFVTSDRSADLFTDFKVLLAQPRYNEPGIIAYYGAHPLFEPFEGVPKDSPYYDPYWNVDGIYLKKIVDRSACGTSLEFNRWMEKLDMMFIATYGLNHSDFEDYNWFDEYSNDVSPEDAFHEWKCMVESGEIEC